MKKPLVLTIAGSDPSGGAGIQADIRAFEAMGVYGFSVITAITVQTAENVIRWEPISKDLIHDQLFVLLDKYPIQYVKCGMLPTIEAINEVIAAKKQFKFQLMVDPIFFSGTGVAMNQTEVIEYFKQNLFPLVDFLTPNAQEVEKLTNMKVTDMKSISEIYEYFAKCGVKTVVIKGGHIHPTGEEVVDYLCEEGGIEAFSRERIINDERVHGTGCIYSAILLSQLALTDDIYSAVSNTENQIDGLFRDIFHLPDRLNNDEVGGGSVLDTNMTPERNLVLNEVKQIYEFIRKQPETVNLIPEVRMNISIGLPTMKSVKDVGAIEGRITIVNNVPYAAGPIKFGVSNHTARLLLTAHNVDNSIRAVMNLKFDREYIRVLSDTKLHLFEIHRENQPNDVQSKERSTMQWIIENVYAELNHIPDIIWDCGEPEKEPMMRLFAKGGEDLLGKLKIILHMIRTLKKKSTNN
jgi:hydroxymethylpyrimidine/phosphomethylpyrimidine kinase